jgi:hypothetical protein
VGNVRNAGFITVNEAAVEIAGQPNRYERQQIAVDLYATVNVETAAGLEAVTSSHLAAWEQTFEHVQQIGQQRLRERSMEAFISVADGLWKAPWTDDLAAARVSLPELLQQVCVDPYVIIVDARTVYVATPTVGNYDRLASILIENFDTTTADIDKVSLRVYQLVGSELRVAVAPEDAAHGEDIRSRVDQERAREYAEERELWMESSQDAVYAQLGMFRNRDNGLKVYWAAWAESIAAVPQLLPEVDLVGFALATEENHMVPFADVAASPGALTRTSAPLPRWRTGPYPSHDWIREHSITRFPWH